MHENDTKLIKDFFQMKLWQGKTRENAKGLCRPVSQFAEFLALRSKTLLTAESSDFGDWLESLTARDIVDYTKSTKLKLVRGFYKWLRSTKLAVLDPTAFWQVRKTWTRKPSSVPKQRLKEILDEARARALAPGATIFEIRNWAILELLYGCGARERETAQLEVDDLSLEKCDVLLHGKGSKDRLPPITKAARDAVKFYLKKARPILASRNKAQRVEELFLSRRGRHLNPQDIWRIVSEVCPGLYPHKLRHSHAQHRADAGEKIENIQIDLGHAQPRTTEIYTPVVTFDQLQSEHRQCHPRGRNRRG